jgi:hypothetical protein
MALKRKTRNLPAMNDQVNQILILFRARKIRSFFFKVSFFDPVYPNDDDENDLLADGIPRPSFRKGIRNESNETLGTDTITNNDQDQSSEVKNWMKLSTFFSYCCDLVDVNIENYYAY